MRGEYDEAVVLADRALERGRQSHGLNGEQAWAGIMFIRAWDQGHLRDVIGVVDQASQAAPHLPIWRVGLAACLASAGRHDEARPIVAELVTDAGLQHRLDSLWYAAAGLLAEVVRDLGDEARASILVQSMLPYSGRIVVTGLGRASLGPVDRFIGVAAHAAGQIDLAEHHLVAAADQARAMEAWPHLARAPCTTARQVRRERARPDDVAEAVRLEDEAERIARRLGSCSDRSARA